MKTRPPHFFTFPPKEFFIEMFRRLFFILFLAALGGLVYLVRFLKQGGELRFPSGLEARAKHGPAFQKEPPGTQVKNKESFLDPSVSRKFLRYFQAASEEHSPGLSYEEQ